MSNNNNSNALNKQILNIDPPVEKKFYSTQQTNFLKNIRIPNYEILNYVGIGLLVLYFSLKK